jgi:uncharacterized membrane protein
MEAIKTVFFNKFRIFSMLFLSMFACIILLMIRMKITQSFFLLFLVWNLFLATLPYLISTYLLTKEKLNKPVFLILFICWLAVLPNAPYILTDLLHLRSNESQVWLDMLIIVWFATNGMLLYFLSLRDMEVLLQKHFKIVHTTYIIISCSFLSGFGIYLGRILRWNSWDIIQDPWMLFQDLIQIVVAPSQHIEAWIFTFGFGAFLALGYTGFKQFKEIS